MRSRTFREGSVGLLLLLGIIVFGGIIIWLQRLDFGRGSYNIIIEFPQTTGILVGGPVFYRGVEVGRIVSIKPSLNNVDVTVQVVTANLIIPSQVEVRISRSGLIGESFIEIMPLKDLDPESSDIKKLNPLSSDCDPQIIICNKQRISDGKPGVDLVGTLSRFSELYTDPEFYERLNRTTENISNTAVKIAELSEELSLLSETIRQDIPTLIASLNRTANEATEQIIRTSDNFDRTSQKINTLADNLNDLIVSNRDTINQTLSSINQTSDDLDQLVTSLQFTVNRVNTSLENTDITQLFQNIEVLTANLREVSEALNDPSNIVTLQQTLDSARVTFANAQKITSDVDELTGDPEFRNNVRRLVDGLSSLVSSTDNLEQQIENAQTLADLQQELAQQIEAIERLQSEVRTEFRDESKQETTSNH